MRSLSQPKPTVSYLVTEPSDAVYAALIDFAVARCTRFYLVWREQLEFNESAQQFEATLRPWEIDSVRTDTWDGTRLLGHYASVRHYRLDRESADILASAV